VPEPELVTFRPSAHPGARLPHTWLPDGRSLYDLLGAEFTLLRSWRGPDSADGAARLPREGIAVPDGCPGPAR
ncbi:hypothetical protein, partial [Modestobacter sp. KNN46-3]|uniref:hypothetical protein n=1 Tax=Modestobacter sp. KNN46-3 TaxID=2711218 RepID=UPI0019D209B6